MEPTAREREQVTRALKRLRSEPVSYRPVDRGGSTPARRWIVTLADGRSAFVKAATDELTASWLRDEHVIYSVLRGTPFMPGYIGWADDGQRPVLALEDLSGQRWPPPWERADVDAVLDALRTVATTPPPEGTPLAADDAGEVGAGWEEVARDPSPFLALGLCPPSWLYESLGTLREAAAAAPWGGDALLHFDVRSDNICIREGRAVFVDWNLVTVGNPAVDVAFWLPSLEAEGGPRPEDVLPGADPGLVAAVAAFFCARAARPPVAGWPEVRSLQLEQARTALPWAARALALPEPAPAATAG